MTPHDVREHELVKSSRFMTGTILLAGFAVLGTGIGTVLAHPLVGGMVGVGTWLVTIGFIRAARGS